MSKIADLETILHICCGMKSDRPIFAIVSYPFLPATTGGEISTLQILNYLGATNPLTVYTVDPYKKIDPSNFNFELIFGMRFKKRRYLQLGQLITILKEIDLRKTKYVFFDQPWMAWMIPFLRVFGKQKIFIRSNNIEYLRFKSMGKKWWSILYLYEKWAYQQANLVIFVSDVDQAKAIEEFNLDANKTLLTPYGVPFATLPEKTQNAKNILCNTHSIEPNASILLFFATMSYAPNYEAVALIAEQIYPLLEAKNLPFHILICGKNLPKAIEAKLNLCPKLTYCGFVEDIETYIDGADLMLNPILSGGGIKTKAVDTLARGKAIVSTQTGAEGIDPSVCGNLLTVVEDGNWTEFVNAIAQKLNEPSGHLPEIFYQKYSWQGIVKNIENKLDQLD